MILKLVIWRFQIYNILRETFRRFTKAFKNFSKYIIGFIFTKFKYFTKEIICNIQITHFKMIHDMFVFYDFEIFSNFQKGLNSDYFAKIVHKIAKSKYFPDISNDLDSPINSLFDLI